MSVGIGLIAVFAILGAKAQAQAAPVTPYYSRANTFGVLMQYSNDSSHILLGAAEQRKLLNIGGEYRRRLLQNGVVNWQYDAEVLPVALESDPTDHFTLIFTTPTPSKTVQTEVGVYACQSNAGHGSETIQGVTYTYSYTNVCGRQWTIGEGMSPIGFQWNFLPRRKLQPVVLGHGGYMYSTQPIPIPQAGSFNFTFDIGVGFELYRSRTRSMRADYRYHHISDHYTSQLNPGIDNGVISVTYAFGR